MKCLKFVLLSVILVVISQDAYSQSKSFISVNAGVVLPYTKLTDYYKTGLEFGVKSVFSKKLNLVVGLLYSNYPGKSFEIIGYSLSEGGNVTETKTNESFESSSITKLFAGPQLEFNSFYLLPTMGFNFSGGSFRMGLDGILGVVVKLNDKYFIDISGRYELQNLIGKKEGELNLTAFHTGIGIGLFLK